MAKIKTAIEAVVDIDVDEFFSNMDDNEILDTALLIVNSNCDKQKLYQQLAHHIGNSDSENLEYLISELQYWSKK